MFAGPFSESILKRAQEKDLIEINLINLRDFAEDKHKTVDDTPYGGGKGMVIKVDVVDKALIEARSPHFALRATRGKQEPIIHQDYAEQAGIKTRVLLMDPRGNKFCQEKAIELSEYDNVILLCGHYEGFDERVTNLIDESISIGDFVLTGGELPAMAIVDAVSRMVSGVLSEGSADDETFMKKDENGQYQKEYPQYTKPAIYKEMSVPDILLSGDHKKIAKWRDERRK